MRAIEHRVPRLVIGRDARIVDRLQRLLPVRYWFLLRGQMGPKAFHGDTGAAPEASRVPVTAGIPEQRA